MKQTLIMLSLSMVFASCGTGGNDQTTAVLQKKVDSLTAIVGGTINTSEKFKTTVVNSFVEPPRLITDEPKEYYYLSYFKAYQGIDSWRSYVRDARNGLIGDTARFSFIIPATTLRYLVDPDSMNLDYVTFYLALDSANLITLMYEGGKIRTNDTGGRVLAEEPVYTHAGIKYVFNHAYPCPICDIVGFGK